MRIVYCPHPISNGMKRDFSVFQFKEIDPPKNLEKMIIARIAARAQRTARFRFAALGTLSLASIGSIVPLFSYLIRSFGESGFSRYISLGELYVCVSKDRTDRRGRRFERHVCRDVERYN